MRSAVLYETSTIPTQQRKRAISPLFWLGVVSSTYLTALYCILKIMVQRNAQRTHALPIRSYVCPLPCLCYVRCMRRLMAPLCGFHHYCTPGVLAPFSSFEPNSSSLQPPTFRPPSFLLTLHHNPTSLSQMNCQMTQVQLL